MSVRVRVRVRLGLGLGHGDGDITESMADYCGYSLLMNRIIALGRTRLAIFFGNRLALPLFFRVSLRPTGCPILETVMPVLADVAAVGTWIESFIPNQYFRVARKT